MSVRWRMDGTLHCGAMTEPEENDTYIDDHLHYQLSVIQKVLIADPDHVNNGLWHWKEQNGEPSDMG